jgi:hypothetical protein
VFDIEHRMFDIEQRVFDVEHRVFDVEHRVFDVEVLRQYLDLRGRSNRMMGKGVVLVVVGL